MHGEEEDEAWEFPGEAGWGRRRGGHRGHRRGPGGPRRGGFGPGYGFGPPGFGPGFGPGVGHWGGGEKFFMRGPRVKRGDVRLAALALLAEEPRNGYQIIQEISERSGGLWRPSPGSVYPALQQLEDEGLIQAETGEGGRRRYALTGEGREYVAAHDEQLQAPWDVVARSVGSGAIEIRQLIGGVAMAAVQVARAGSDAQFEQATRLLAETQRGLYRILAADDEDTGEEQAPQE